MANELAPQLTQFLINRPYYAAFLFVHPHMGRLHEVTTQLRRQYDWPFLALGQELSLVLRDIAPQQRPSRTPRLLTDILRPYSPGPLLCANIALLFEPTLQLNPLRLLLEASKTTTLIIPWPGSYQAGTLAYAVPEHTHYRTWVMPDLCDYCIVPV